MSLTKGAWLWSRDCFNILPFVVMQRIARVGQRFSDSYSSLQCLIFQSNVMLRAQEFLSAHISNNITLPVSIKQVDLRLLLNLICSHNNKKHLD